jgi:type II secretory pathway pseudopilin PulG
MAALSNIPPKKYPKNNRTMLYAGIIAVVVIIVIAAAAAAYLYMDDQARQNKNREALKQAFSDQLNATGEVYAKVTEYQAAPDKNYVEDFRVWIDGYSQRVGDYSHAVNKLLSNGTAYRKTIASDSSDYANVTQACNQANDTIRSLNDSIRRYETEYQGRLSLKNNASADYNMALERSARFYTAAWDQMHNEITYVGSGFYHDFLKGCELNISYYNQSIALVQSTGALYQTYLRGNSFYSINTTISDMQDNVTKLQKRYVELQKHIPNVTVEIMTTIPTFATDGTKFTTAYDFMVYNNDFPMQISDVVVHFQLVDRATGTVRSTRDVNVEMASGLGASRQIYKAELECEENGNYSIKYTLSYDY